jgi:hypothetical protein
MHDAIALVPQVSLFGLPSEVGRAELLPFGDDHERTGPFDRGFVGMNRWVGLGVIADNIVNVGRAMERKAAR